MFEKVLNQRKSGQVKQTTWGQDGDRMVLAWTNISQDRAGQGQDWTTKSQTGLDHLKEVRTGLDQYKLG
jgi:hypothetical protein